MTPIERAASQLWRLSNQPHKVQDNVPAMQVPEPEPDWERFVPLARAVLQAIREPSEAMLTAAAAVDLDSPASAEINGSVYWHRMIDAALDEG